MFSYLALNVDFILILQSGLWLLLASASWSLAHPPQRCAWRWLTWFALGQFGHCGAELILLAFGTHPLTATFHDFSLLASHGCLLEFARQSLPHPRASRTIFLPLGGILLTAALVGGDSNLLAWTGFALAMVAGAWAGAALAAPAPTPHAGSPSRSLRLGGLSLVLFQFFISYPSSVSGPAELLPDPAQFMLLSSGLLALCLSAAVLTHSWAIEKNQWTKEQFAGRQRRRRGCAALVLMLGLAGWLTADYAGRRQDETMRKQILARTHIATAAIPAEAVQQLFWDERDLQNPAYLRLKSLLMAMRHANPDLRFVLIAGLRDGRAYFLADSENPASSDYSPPGQSYDEATPEYLAGLGSDRPFVLGPETDRWGTWMYGDVPILNQQGKAVAYLELNIAAADWNAHILHARLPALLITLLIATLLVGSFISLEHLRENAARIAESEQRNRSLVEGSPDCVQMFDLAGHYVAVNQNGLSALGLPASAVLGRSFAELWPEAARPRLTEAVHTTLAGQPTSFEADYVTPDGRTVTWRVATNPIFDHEGHVSGFVGICVDLTVRKQAEIALLAAKKSAEEATQAKSDFLAVMSHEIRTPLAGIMGMLDLLNQAPLLPQPRRYTQFARESAESLLHLLDDALDSAKIEAGKLTLESIPFRPRDYFEGIFATAAMRATAKGLAFHHHVTPTVPAVLIGDPSRLRQVVNNLVNNALKFTEQGSLTVTLDTTAATSSHEIQLRILVTDTGIGISHEQLGRLFAKYSQADTSTTRRYGGTGLGLSIVKSLAELMSGEVTVTSTQGVGSTFTFTGRLAVGQEQDCPITLPAPAATPTVTNTTRLRVLVVDDDAANRTVATALVSNLGHQVELAFNGREAVERLQREAFDLVLMDQRMPVMDGLSATRFIRDPANRATDPHIYIIALTANASTDDRAQCLQAGMNDFITKPVRAPIMSAAVGRASQALAQRQGLPRALPPPPPARPPGLSADELLAAIDAEENAPAPSADDALPPGVMEKIIALFLQEGPGRMTTLRTAFARQEIRIVAREAHTLKSNARYLNAPVLADLAARAESLADQNSLEPLGPLLDELERAHTDLREHLLARIAA